MLRGCRGSEPCGLTASWGCRPRGAKATSCERPTRNGPRLMPVGRRRSHRGRCAVPIWRPLPPTRRGDRAGRPDATLWHATQATATRALGRRRGVMFALDVRRPWPHSTTEAHVIGSAFSAHRRTSCSGWRSWPPLACLTGTWEPSGQGSQHRSAGLASWSQRCDRDRSVEFRPSRINSAVRAITSASIQVGTELQTAPTDRGAASDG